MYTSCLVVALAGLTAAAQGSDTPSWQTDYSQARKTGVSEGKPLVVVHVAPSRSDAPKPVKRSGPNKSSSMWTNKSFHLALVAFATASSWIVLSLLKLVGPREFVISRDYFPTALYAVGASFIGLITIYQTVVLIRAAVKLVNKDDVTRRARWFEPALVVNALGMVVGAFLAFFSVAFPSSQRRLAIAWLQLNGLLIFWTNTLTLSPFAALLSRELSAHIATMKSNHLQEDGKQNENMQLATTLNAISGETKKFGLIFLCLTNCARLGTAHVCLGSLRYSSCEHAWVSEKFDCMGIQAVRF